jgi:hypothetical protein
VRSFVLGVLLLAGCGSARPISTEKPRPRPKPVLALPGTCVDPVNDALDRLGPDADREGLREERSVDLDGDGNHDALITHGAFCGTGGCTWHVYVTRGTCGHYVGELFGMLPLARPTVVKGLVELEVVARTGCAGMARTETRARFDGTAYLAYSVRKCRCPEEADEAIPEPDPEKLCEPWRAVSSSP